MSRFISNPRKVVKAVAEPFTQMRSGQRAPSPGAKSQRAPSPGVRFHRRDSIESVHYIDNALPANRHLSSEDLGEDVRQMKADTDRKVCPLQHVRAVPTPARNSSSHRAGPVVVTPAPDHHPPKASAEGATSQKYLEQGTPRGKKHSLSHLLPPNDSHSNHSNPPSPGSCQGSPRGLNSTILSVHSPGNALPPDRIRSPSRNPSPRSPNAFSSTGYVSLHSTHSPRAPSR